jgi:RNA polymerase sigma factor (TIGR02999 family)
MQERSSEADAAEVLAVLRRDAPPGIDAILPIVYDELRRVARRQLRVEPDGHTLNTTALVHEVYIRLAAQRRLDVSDREHFFAIAARVMRRVLVDHARRVAA